MTSCSTAWIYIMPLYFLYPMLVQFVPRKSPLFGGVLWGGIHHMYILDIQNYAGANIVFALNHNYTT